MLTAPAHRPAGTEDVLRRNSVTVTGRPGARPVVFGHGFGCDQTMWRFVTPEFETDSAVVLLDHVGAGGSDLTAHDPRRHSSLRGYAHDLIEVLDTLRLGPVAYVGHSVGAMVGVLAAVERPELFSALVLVGGSPRYIDEPGYTGGFTRTDIDGLLEAMESNYLAWSRALAPHVMGNSDRPELTEELAASFARTESRIAVQFARAIFLSDHRREVARLRVPTLVVQSAEDPMVPPQVAEYLHATIAGSEYAALEATGHFPHLSGAGETAAVVRQFLDRRRR